MKRRVRTLGSGSLLLCSSLVAFAIACPKIKPVDECPGAPECVSDLAAVQDMAMPDLATGPDMLAPTALAPSWSRRIGSPGDETIGALSVSGGDVFLGGYFVSPIDLDGTLFNSYRLLLARLDGKSSLLSRGFPIRDFRFLKQNGRPLVQVAVDPVGDVVVAGTYSTVLECGDGTTLMPGGSSYIYIAKFNGSNGKCLWSKSLGNTFDTYFGLGMAVGRNREIYFAGSFTGQLTFAGTTITSAGGSDIFVARMATEGGEVRIQRYGAAGNEAATGLALDGSDGVVIAGTYEKGTTIGTDILVHRGLTDAFVSKFDKALGPPLWTFAYGGPRADTVAGLAVHPSGDVALTGNFEESIDLDPVRPGGLIVQSAGTIDGYVISLAADSKVRFGKTFGGIRKDEARAIGVDQTGDVYVSGVFTETSRVENVMMVAQAQDFFVARYTGGSGVLKWAAPFGGPADEEVWAMAVSPMGEVYLGGGTRSDPLKIGQKLLAGAGGEDMFLIKFVPAFDSTPK